MRYNLKDKVRFLSWKGAISQVAALDQKNTAVWSALAALPLPDIICVSGRTEGCIFLCGSNIFESMVQDMILQSELAHISSGIFVAWTSMEDGQQILHIQLELKPDEAPPSAASQQRIYQECVKILGRLQPEFADDYEKFYKPYEAQGRQVLRFHFVETPYLTDHPRFANAMKRKVFIERGPL